MLAPRMGLLPLRYANELKGYGMGVLKRRDIREKHHFRPCPLTILIFFILAGLIFPLHEAGADDTGFKVATNVVSAGAWSNCTAAVLNSSNDQRATVTFGNTWSNCVISTFAFGIPAGKAITGIEVQVEGSNSAIWNLVYYGVDLSWDAGASWTTASHTSYFSGTTDSSNTHGGSTDTWGRAWSRSNFSDANFQLRIYRRPGGNWDDLRVDMIQVKVYYTAYLEKVTYSNATTGTSFVVPTGVTSITVKSWGGGGGGGGEVLLIRAVRVRATCPEVVYMPGIKPIPTTPAPQVREVHQDGSTVMEAVAIPDGS
jgi:hypothetical protein